MTSREFVKKVAEFTMDEECIAHGQDCGGYQPDCDLFDMQHEDAMDTLANLILKAREIVKGGAE